MYYIIYINNNICKTCPSFVVINKELIMETTISKTYIERNTKLIVIGAFFGSMGIISLILHISPLAILGKLAGFAEHHYFLAGFIFLIAASACLKFYYSKNAGEGKRISLGKSRAIKRRILLANLKRKIGIIGNLEDSSYIKEDRVALLKFSNEEILISKLAKQNRQETIQKAKILGNLYKQKVIVCFKDNNKAKHTLAIISDAYDEYVLLNSGTKIPVNRIYKIEI